MGEKGKNKLTFENAVTRLDEIILRLDSGELPMDEALLLFSEGSQLIAFCGEKLETARLTVETLFPDRETKETIAIKD